MSERPIRVLAVDDSATMRQLLAQVIQAQPDMELLDTAASGQEALRRATELQPDIVLMDIHMPDMDGIQAAWLLSSRAPHGAVIMVTSEERIDFLQKAMTAGAQGYVLKPFGDGTQLVQTIRDVYGRTAARRMQPESGPSAATPARLRIGKRVAVFGTKGGAGRTTIATGLALGLRQQTQGSVLLMDADFLFGDASIHLDLNPQRTILDLVPHMEALDSRLIEQVTVRHPTGIHFLARPHRPEQADVLRAEHVRIVLRALAHMYDYVVVDTQLSYDDRMLAVLDLADLYVVVVIPHMGSLRNTRHFLDVARTLGYSEERMLFVLNRANSLAGLHLDDISSVIGTRRILRLPSAGLQLTQAINEGKPYLTHQPRIQFSNAMATVAEQVRQLLAGAEPARR